MKKSKNLKSNLKRTTSLDTNFNQCIHDLLDSQEVENMQRFPQHCDYSCFDHCLYVSYISFRLCRRLGLDSKSAARGAMLHDMFLYDWRVTSPPEGLHAFHHPRIALQKAEQIFRLNEKEVDIIAKHMWPLTLAPPKYKESFIVCLTDKYCTLNEIRHYYSQALISGGKHFILTKKTRRMKK